MSLQHHCNVHLTDFTPIKKAKQYNIQESEGLQSNVNVLVLKEFFSTHGMRHIPCVTMWKYYQVVLLNKNISIDFTMIHAIQNTRKPVGLWHSWKHGIHTGVSEDKLLTTTIAICMPKSLCARTFKCFLAVLPGLKSFVYYWGTNSSQIGNAIEKIYNVTNRLCHCPWSPNI